MNWFVFGIIILILIIISIKQVEEYERGIKFQLGKYHSVLKPGWRIVIPIIQSVKIIDIRTKAVDVPEQDAITRDNISVRINAVLYYKISDAKKSILAVEDFKFAISQLASTTMRNAVGTVSLDELLSERKKISDEICNIVDKATDAWGIEVENVELKDISLPEEMKRVIAAVAEAEREKEAIITLSKGEVIASDNLAKAATIMAKSPGALHLRTLSTINDLSTGSSNTVVFAIPIEILEAIKGKDVNNIIDKITKK